jgi:hypothetical protein
MLVSNGGSMTKRNEVFQIMTRSKMTVTSLAAITAAMVLMGPPAEAQNVGPTNSLVTVSDTPAATLLGPYFEVDLSNPTGMNTIFSINNTGAVSYFTFGNPPMTFADQNGPTAILAHVVIWSDLGVPVFNFNIYLTGFDVQLIDMRKVLNGNLPQTASAGQDSSDTISPKGMYSQDINFASCTGQLPPAPLSAAQIANLTTSLTGNPSAQNGGMCAGAPHNDNIARGYITVDTVDSCSTQSPEDAGYIQNIITFQSFQLTGEVFYVDQLHGIARGDNMVPVHADLNNPLVSTSGNYTFYGRYVNWNASDHRQPLPNTFAARYLSGNFTGDPLPTVSAAWGGGTVPAGSTSLVVWRDSKTAQQYFACGSLPSPYPLGQEDITAFDEQEHPQTASGNSLFAFGAAFPLATQVVRVGSSALPVSFNSGWVYLDLSNTINGNPNPPSDPAAAQGWVQVIEQNFNGFFSVMHRAQAVDSGTKAAHIVIN